MSRETFKGTADDIAEALAPFCIDRDWFQYGEKLSKKKLRKNNDMLKACKRLSDNWNLQKRKVAAAMGKIMAKQRIHWPQDLESKHEARALVLTATRAAIIGSIIVPYKKSSL